MTHRPLQHPCVTPIQAARLKKVLAEASALVAELQDGGLRLAFQVRTVLDDCESWPEVVAEISSERSTVLRARSL